MKRMGILSGAPQSVTQIDEESYSKIKNEGGIDVRFVVN